MNRTKLAKWYRKASVTDFNRRLIELGKEKSVVDAKRKAGHKLENTSALKQIKKDIAMLKTIARERGMILDIGDSQ